MEPLKAASVLLLAVFVVATVGCEDEPKSLGGTCTSDSDCQTSVYCELLGPPLEGQCTSPCVLSNAEKCPILYGPDAVCIAEGYCVLSCLSSSECPNGTICNDDLWCDRL